MAAALSPFIAYCIHPTHNVNDVMCCVTVDHTTGTGLRPLIFLNSGVGSFTSHKNQISESAVTSYRKQHVSYCTQLESSNVRSPVPCKHRSGK